MPGAAWPSRSTSSTTARVADGNHLGHFGPYFTSEYATPWGDAVNFDGPGSDELRRFFCDNALDWLERYRFDGLRLDAVHAFLDRRAVPFLEQLVATCTSWSKSWNGQKC